MCRSIKRFSKRRPEFRDTTGSSGTSPETAKTEKNNDVESDQQNPTNFSITKNQNERERVV